MNTYPTVSQATGVARTLSKSAGCTIVVYQTDAHSFVTARPTDTVNGLVVGVYRDGYLVRYPERKAGE
jgi:hypothetical protein